MTCFSPLLLSKQILILQTSQEPRKNLPALRMRNEWMLKSRSPGPWIATQQPTNSHLMTHFCTVCSVVDNEGRLSSVMDVPCPLTYPIQSSPHQSVFSLRTEYIAMQNYTSFFPFRLMFPRIPFLQTRIDPSIPSLTSVGLHAPHV